MKLISHFTNFLRDTVNLNQTRIDDLDSSVEAIKKFVRESNWEPRVWKFIEQGSWAHNTIIRPVEGGEFDADLLVIVEPIDGWNPSDYIDSLGRIFISSGRYVDKVQIFDYCITITYAGYRKIDIAPCVRGRLLDGQLEVCNKREDTFERSEPLQYTEWFNTKNTYSGSNTFRKVTRLIKYLRDIEGGFECPSIILTTLIGERINWNDDGSANFVDVPTTLKTIIGRLDDWLQLHQIKPSIYNPHLRSEDFAKDFTQNSYSKFRNTIHQMRSKIDYAYDIEGKYASITAWRDIFGQNFAKGHSIVAIASVNEQLGFDKSEDTFLTDVAKPNADHDSTIVDLVRTYGRWLWKPKFDRPKHMSAPIWARADIVSDRVEVIASWQPSRHSPVSTKIRDFDELSNTGGIWFDVLVNNGASLPPEHRVRYRVTNTGAVAIALKKGRGGFETPQEFSRRWENLEYRGIHLVEAFIIRDRDDKIVGQSMPFHVVIQ
ncbi:nucleotidyltransferase [Methylobacterium sp. 77]|uniref:SMODS domain-containing nucleotidyltransferase n=1 Tax=Methylobacterium sp. 77 TaxID=1101192 RepID=UPI0003A0725C|nr:nucleotidyltransferase [Methylobacterium sp. 77]